MQTSTATSATITATTRKSSMFASTQRKSMWLSVTKVSGTESYRARVWNVHIEAVWVWDIGMFYLGRVNLSWGGPKNEKKASLSIFLLCHCQDVQNLWYHMDLLLGHRTTKSPTPATKVISFLRKAGGGKRSVWTVYGLDWSSVLVIIL